MLNGDHVYVNVHDHFCDISDKDLKIMWPPSISKVSTENCSLF